MSEQISVENMALLEQALGRIENDGAPTCERTRWSDCAGATDASLDFWRRAVEAVPLLLAEIRARRAVVRAAGNLDGARHEVYLTGREVDALRELAAKLRQIGTARVIYASNGTEVALEALDKLTGGAS